MLNNKMK